MKFTKLTGKIVTPLDPEYGEVRQIYNQAIQRYPIIIVYCFNSRDVANAVIWSRQQGFSLRIRSGGHHYEGYSIGTGKLIIDTTYMDEVTVNTQDDTVEVQAGTRLLRLYEILYEYGYTFPGGTCPTVAISGLVLGGGVGLSTRFLGLTEDSLVEAEMIDAEGNVLTLSRDSNPELFWAIRGAGGGNFGVLTKYKFRLRKVNKITLVRLRWDNNIAARNVFLPIWQEWLKNLDLRMSTFSGIYKRGAWVNGFYYGKPNAARKVLNPLLNIPGLTLEVIEYIPFIDAVKNIGAGYPLREAFKTAGRFVQRSLSQRELNGILRVMDKAPDERESSIRVYSLGGAVRNVEPDDSAFSYRGADYVIAVTSAWQRKYEALEHKRWVKKGFDYLYPITQGSYVNFPYSQTPNYKEAYYGRNVGRLQRIKKKYDPCNTFNFPQGLGSSRRNWFLASMVAALLYSA